METLKYECGVAMVRLLKPSAGELYMGQLQYSKTGESGISYNHPFLRCYNWRAEKLIHLKEISPKVGS